MSDILSVLPKPFCNQILFSAADVIEITPFSQFFLKDEVQNEHLRVFSADGGELITRADLVAWLEELPSRNHGPFLAVDME